MTKRIAADVAFKQLHVYLLLWQLY